MKLLLIASLTAELVSAVIAYIHASIMLAWTSWRARRYPPHGQTMVEYALFIVLVAILAIGVIDYLKRR